MDQTLTKLQAKGIPIQDVFKRLNIPGSNGKYHCINPEHADRHPSLILFSKTNSFHCFSCQLTGDVITAYMLVMKTDFKGALELLKSDFPGFFGANIGDPKTSPVIFGSHKKEAPKYKPDFLCSYDEYTFDERAGLAEYFGEVERFKAEEIALRHVTTERLEVNKKIFRGFYDYCRSCFPYGMDGKAFDYLVRHRQLSEDAVTASGIFTMKDSRSAEAYLLDTFDIEEVRGSGLISKSNKLLFKDTHRLIIPYFDFTGDIVYMRARYFDKEGRTQSEAGTKYLGLRNDATNLNRARRLYRDHILNKLPGNSELYIFEGELDALAGESAGLNSLAIPGANNFPFDLIGRLRSYFINICLDADEAGANARQKIIDEFAKANKRVNVITFPDGVKDMNELLMLEGSHED